MRHSLIWPLVLIGLGGVMLAHNLRVDFSFWRLLGDYWPYVLILWGLVRLVEIGILAAQGKALPRRGISGGEWAVVILISILASSIWFASETRERLRAGRINLGNLAIFQETFEYPLSGKIASPVAPRILVENRRGNVRLVGGEQNEVVVTGHHSIMGENRAVADRVGEKMRLELAGQGDRIVIRTNQEQAGGEYRVESDIEVRIPRGASVECRGTRGDFDVSQINGNFEVISDNAGVRGKDIGGNVRVEVRRSDIVRLAQVKGNVDVKGNRGEDLELEDIAGVVVVEGQFTGDLEFRRIAKAMRFNSERTNLTIEKLEGRARLSDGDFEVEGLGGAMRFSSRSKDIRVSDFGHPVQIELERGDIELWPGGAALAPIVANTSSGSVTLHLPEDAKFDLNAISRRGEVENLYGPPLERREENRGGTIRGANGGPRIALSTGRGTVTVQKAAGQMSRKNGATVPGAAKPPAVVER
ncbi:MAG: DUF4097 family beta strand repeat-containing protein [Acidobacteriota bacterium]